MWFLLAEHFHREMGMMMNWIEPLLSNQINLKNVVHASTKLSIKMHMSLSLCNSFTVFNVYVTVDNVL